MEEALKQQPSNCIRVVLYGPESTGKTTLSKQLAKHYHTVWVPEYARGYLQSKWNLEKKTCENSDLLPIAKGQMALENTLAQKANKVLICDTDLLETKVYSETYYDGDCHHLIHKYAQENAYDLYCLTYIDTPWEADDLRDKPHERQEMFEAFKKALEDHNKNYVILKGDKKQRLSTAISYIDKLLKKSKMMFREDDIAQLENKGLTLRQVEGQLELFKKGIPFTKIEKAATLNDGIIKLSEDSITKHRKYYETQQNDLDTLKFVPASGAASRMFKFLFQFLESFHPETSELAEFKNEDPLLDRFFSHLEEFPFYNRVLVKLKEQGITYSDLNPNDAAWHFVNTMLNEDLLNYGSYPKGLLPFHKYDTDDIATAYEEHLYETALYASQNKKVKLHFTITKGLKHQFNDLFVSIKEDVERRTGVEFEVSYSYQQERTDTIAVTLDNDPFRLEDDSILYRPSGHGALLKNLNAINTDLIFIKNIDNVVVSRFKEEVAKYKKVLAGILLEKRNKTYRYLELLEQDNPSASAMSEIKSFLENELNTKLSDDFSSLSDNEKQQLLKSKLNRPIRVCGMVKNEGEPGGGPFWVKDQQGHLSLQIVETAQINLEIQSQKDILQNATHFNPVDIVCSTKNYKGEPFNLEHFIDPNTGFITQKTKAGMDLKALELPGLWNGSMANWNTVFVEVPIVTFNPVKTVNDLLKPAHQVHPNAS